MLHGLHATGKAHSPRYCALATVKDASRFEGGRIAVALLHELARCGKVVLL